METKPISFIQNRYPYETTGINFHLFTPHFIQTPMCAELNLGPDWFKNAIFPKPEGWSKTAMKSLDQNRINADIAGFPMHEVICAMQRNWGEFYFRLNEWDLKEELKWLFSKNCF